MYEVRAELVTRPRNDRLSSVCRFRVPRSIRVQLVNSSRPSKDLRSSSKRHPSFATLTTDIVRAKLSRSHPRHTLSFTYSLRNNNTTLHSYLKMVANNDNDNDNNGGNDFFERVSLGQAYSRMFSIFGNRIDVFLLLSAVSYIPLGLFLIILVPLVFSEITYENKHYGEPNPTTMTEIVVFSAISFVLRIIFDSIGSAAMSHAVGKHYLGLPLNALESLKWAFRKTCALLGSAALLALFVGLGMGAAIAVFMLLVAVAAQEDQNWPVTLGYYVMIFGMLAVLLVTVKFDLAVQAITIENKGPIDGLKRSWELTHSGYGFLFCTLFIFGVVTAIVISIFQNLVAQSLVGVILSTVLPGLISHPLKSILTTILYFHFRVEKESMNGDVLRNDLTGEVSLDDPKPGKYSPVVTLSEKDVGFLSNNNNEIV